MWTRVFGPSMWPLIWSGARVRLELCALEDLKRGDIAAVLTPLGPVLHRVVERDGVLCTQGDWRAVCDGPIDGERLLGRADGIVLGRWTVGAPRGVARLFNRSALAVLPAVRLLQRRRVITTLRRGRDAVVGSAVGRAFFQVGSIVVRVLEPEDEQALRRAAWTRGQYASPTHAELRDLVRGRGGCVIAAIHPTRGIVGQLLLKEEDEQGTVGAWDHWVNPWFRGRGLGAKLIRTAMHAAWDRGHCRLVVVVRDQARSRRLWAQFGAEPHGAPFRSGPEPGAFIVLQLMLAGPIEREWRAHAQSTGGVIAKCATTGPIPSVTTAASSSNGSRTLARSAR